MVLTQSREAYNGGMNKNKIEQIFEASKKPADFAKNYLTYLSELLAKMDANAIGDLIETFEAARERGNKIIFLGNGGSAATASHFANDIGVGTRAWHKPFKALALTDNVAVITAIGNDHGYDAIFELQLIPHLNNGDVVVAISASGNSPNVVKAIKYANDNGGITVGLTGFDGGELYKLAHKKIHVQTAKGEYGPVEDIHMVMDHLIGAYLNQKCKTENRT